MTGSLGGIGIVVNPVEPRLILETSVLHGLGVTELPVSQTGDTQLVRQHLDLSETLMEEILRRHDSGIDIIDQDSTEPFSRHIPINENGGNTHARGPLQGFLATQARSHNQAFNIVTHHCLDEMGQFMRRNMSGKGCDGGISS